ncbi:agmatinase [Desulfosoma caldarium]|uniref:Agmatinase n=1 Tax=Desulfosoma caldarium TaxID=610254 RepID=A0A3N1UQZ8_9BACT|nr:agmatinase [Desulfosoma caldarium]ROQ91120.1 agmatinase [Desulfosoma caldarium]
MKRATHVLGTEVMQYLGPCLSFLGLPEYSASVEAARAVIVAAPYDGTTTFRSGTREGPRAILAASRELECYEEDTGTEPYRHGIATLGELRVTAASPRDMVERVRAVAAALFKAEKIPVLLGGEHLMSLGMIRAACEHFGPLTVLHLDAHPDLRESYQETSFSNACVMRHVLNMADVVQVGLRSMTREEHDLIRHKRIPAFFAEPVIRDSNAVSQIVDALGPWVYVTIDLDVLDPSIMPAVGTPEPGGLGWYDLMSVIRAVTAQRRVVGFDVMELCPIPGMVAPDFLAARLVHKILAHIFVDKV